MAADSGLIVVLLVISLLLVTVFLPLLTVQYEWCHVLFENNTVRNNIVKGWHYIFVRLQENPLCTKNNREDKLLLKMENSFSVSKGRGKSRLGRQNDQGRMKKDNQRRRKATTTSRNKKVWKACCLFIRPTPLLYCKAFPTMMQLTYCLNFSIPREYSIKTQSTIMLWKYRRKNTNWHSMKIFVSRNSMAHKNIWKQISPLRLQQRI